MKTFLEIAIPLALMIGTIIGVAWADYRLGQRMRQDEEDHFRYRMRNTEDDDAQDGGTDEAGKSR